MLINQVVEYNTSFLTNLKIFLTFVVTVLS